MPSIPRQFSPPINWQDFQRLALRVLQKRWQCPELELFGRPGEGQYGVDILDVSGKSPLRAGQCKRYDRAPAEADIRSEVEKAKTFPRPLDFYAILTTAKKSTASQLAVLKINDEHRSVGLFTVALITWDDINDFLNENSDVADEFYGGIGAQAATRMENKLDETLETVRTFSQAPANQGPPTAYDDQIDEARRYLNDHEYTLARFLLQRLRERHWDQLSQRQKFRLLSNLAATRLEEGATEVAARLFLEAKDLQPEDQIARENELLAHELLGDHEGALRLSLELRQRFPNSARAWSVWLQESRDDPADLEKQIPPPLSKEPEVCLAMARCFAMQQRHADAERFARTATERLPSRSYPLWLLGQTILASTTTGGIDKRVGPESNEAERLKEARAHFDKAAEMAQEEKRLDIRALALLGASFVEEMLGRKREADKYVESAFACCPDDPPVLVSYSTLLRSRGNLPEAILLLRKANERGAGDQGVFLLAEALSKRAGAGDLEEALDLLKAILASPERLQPGLREHAACGALDVLKRLGTLEYADALLASAPAGAFSTVATEGIRARLALLREDVETARVHAQTAKDAIDEVSQSDDLRLVAVLLNELGQYSDALPLWQRLGSRATINYDTQELINCAGRLGQDGILLDLCRKLRESGIEDGQLLRLEIDLLQRYDVEKAIQLIQHYLEQNPADRSVRLRLSVIGMQHGRADLISANADGVPPAETISPNEGVLAVWILRMAGNPDEALRYAYRLLRLHYGDVYAGRAFLSAMNPLGPKPNVPTFESVAPGAAVCFAEMDSAAEQWLVIEESDPPDSKLQEAAPTEPLAQRLLGRREGETFLLAEGRLSGVDRRAVIRRILSKFVFRYQQLLEQWSIRYQSGEIEAVHVTTGGRPEDFDVTAILRALERKKETTKDIEAAYFSQPIAIHEVGRALGLNDFDAQAGLLAKDAFAIRCADGSASDIEAALSALGACTSLVLDFTALGTLVFLDRLDVLRRAPVPIIVPQSTMAVLQRMVIEAKSSLESQSGFLGASAGGLAFAEWSESDKKKHLDALTKSIDLLRMACKITGAVSLAYIEPNDRTALANKFGEHGAEALVLASMPGHILWTDDHVAGLVAKLRFGARRVWTQVVFQSWARDGIIEPSVFYDVTAKLIGWEYFFTSPNTPALVRAAALAEWDPDRWPLKQALRLFRSESIALRDAIGLAAEFMVQLYKSASGLSGRCTAIVVALLDNLAARPGGTDSLKALRITLPRLFGLNVLAADEVARAIDARLSGGKVLL
jgi:tetratricopeptide (TPR) repeat protein